MLGVTPAGTMLPGCFVPIIYGAYKGIDKGDRQVVSVRMAEDPEKVYRAAPKAEREEIVNTVLSVCRKNGIQCTEEKGKK